MKYRGTFYGRHTAQTSHNYSYDLLPFKKYLITYYYDCRLQFINTPDLLLLGANSYFKCLSLFWRGLMTEEHKKRGGGEGVGAGGGELQELCHL